MQWYKEQDKALCSTCSLNNLWTSFTLWQQPKLFIREKNNKCLHGDLCCTCAQLHWTLDRLWQGKQSRQNYKICPTHVTTCPKQATSRPANVYAGLWLQVLSKCKYCLNQQKVSASAGLRYVTTWSGKYISNHCILFSKKRKLSFFFFVSYFHSRPNLKVSSPSRRWLAASPAFTIRSLELTRWTFLCGET